MKVMNVETMEELVGGARWWCVSAGIVTAFAIGTAPIGLLVYGPSAGGLIAACIAS